MQYNKLSTRHTKIRYVLRTLVGKLIWILIIVGILIAKWGIIRRIMGVEMIIIEIHFTKKKFRTSKEKLILRLR